MPLPTAEQIVTQQHKRYFYQLDGAAPEDRMYYAGQDGQYITIESGDLPEGDVSPINVGDPGQYKAYAQVGDEIAAPDFHTFTVNFLQHHGAIPRQLYDIKDCLTTFYEVTGYCKDPSVITRKPEDYVKIYSNGKLTNTAAGGSAFDSDSMVQDDLDFTAKGDIYVVAGLAVGEEAATEVASEVVDIVYGSKVRCQGCGPTRHGTELVYWVQNNTVASPGVGPSVGYGIYSKVTGTYSWTVTAINGATASDIPTAIDIVGQYLVVVFRDATTGGYFYSQINEITGIPGTWTKVTTGFVSGSQPLDIYVASPREVWFCGNGGYIYKSENILTGVSAEDAADTTTDNLNRIDGYGSTIVTVGDGAAVVYSTNRGRTFALATNAPAAFSLDALEVLGDYRWWVGDSEGDIYWTNDRGETAWNELTLPTVSTGTPVTIQDILFATDEIGYIVAATSGPAAIFFSTVNGGRDWEEGSVNTFPTLDRVNRLAVPVVPNKAVAANNVALGGLAGNGTDGIVLLGIAAVK
jgi:hypothetical protein